MKGLAMDYLNSVFQLILDIMQAFVDDNYIGSLLWIFIIVMTLLLFIAFIRGAKEWL